MKTLILVSVVLLCLFTSCKKDENSNTNCDKTMANIAGSYGIIKLEVGAGGIFQDATNQLDACELDDKIVLNANGTSAYQDAGVACSPSGNSAGTWSISAAGKMTIDDGSGSASDISSADITSFDCSTLVLTGTDPSTPGFQLRLTIKK